MDYFGRDHLGVLLAISSVTIGLCALTRRSVRTPGRATAAIWTCRGLALVLVLNWVLEPLAEWQAGIWSPENSLPLHLCDLAAVVQVVALLSAAEWLRRRMAWSPWEAGTGAATPHREIFAHWAFELGYYWGLGGSVQALLTPAIFDAFPSRAFVQFFLGHGTVVIGVFVLTVGVGLRPRPGSVWRAWGVMLLVAAPVGLADWLLGANYMYLAGPPERATLYDYLGPWPVPLATMALLGLAVMWLLYLPFGLLRRLRLATEENHRGTEAHRKDERTV